MLDRGRAGEEGTQDLRDAGQARCVAADPCPLFPNRGLREGAGVRSIVAEQLEVEGVGDLVLARGIVGIHSRREASAASVGEGVGDGGWRGALGARSGAATRGCLGTGAGTAKEMFGASVGASGLTTARLGTLARSSRSGTWGEVRTTAARMTGTRAKNCGEPGGGSSNEAGTALRTALANAGGVD